MNKIKRYTKHGVIALAALLLVVGAVSVRAGWGGSFWGLVADKTADRLVAKVDLPDLEQELGSTGETLNTRNLTGLFDLSLKDGDGSDGGVKLTRQFFTDTIFAAASGTFLSVQNTGAEAMVCRAGLRLFASSSNALPVTGRWSIGTSTVSGLPTSTVFEAGIDDKSVLGVILTTSTNSGQVSGQANHKGWFSTSTSAGNIRSRGSDCVRVDTGHYLIGLQLFESGYLGARPLTADATGYASSSFYWVEWLRVATSS